MYRLSASKENYLKAIHNLDPYGTDVRVTDIAKSMGVTKASVSRMMNKLEKEGYVERFPSRRIGLTDEGRKQVRLVKSRYDIIRLYFVEVLHLHSKLAGQEACNLEHSLSEASLYAMERRLDEQSDWAQLAELAYA